MVEKAGKPSRQAWSMVAIAALTQNTATGLAFGSFGSMILAIEQEFGASRQESSTVIASLILGLSLLAPVVGWLISHVPIRRVMIAGVILGSAGYASLSLLESIQAVTFVYLLVIGPGAALFGVLVSTTLVARWIDGKQGLAVGIVNMPLFVLLVPLACGWFLRHYELRSLFLALAAVQLAVLLPVLFVREPADVGDTNNSTGDIDGDINAAEPDKTSRPDSDMAVLKNILRSPSFWLLVVFLGVVTGGGTMKVAHFVPLLMDQGRSYDEANLLFAVSGGAGILGAFIFGWLADKWGGAIALMINAIVQACVWIILLLPVGFFLLLIDAILVGACGGGIIAAQAVIMSHLFKREHFSQLFGLLALATLPMLYGFTPLAGYLYDTSGSYALPVSMVVGGFIMSAILMLFLVAKERRLRADTLQKDAARA